MKKYLMLVLLVAVATGTFAQGDCPEGVKAEKTLKMWEDIDALFPRAFPVKDLRQDGWILFVTLEDVSDKEFEKWCGTPLNTEELERRFPDANYRIMLSCNEVSGKKKVRAYMEIIGRKPASGLKAGNNDMRMVRQSRSEIEQKLRKMQNTRQYYKDLLATLDKEIKFNQVEVVDNLLGLVKKNVPVDDNVKEIFNAAAAEAMNEWREKEGVSPSGIENKMADAVDGAVDLFEKGTDILKKAGYSPDKIDVLKGKIPPHRLGIYYAVFRSLPELGKGLGHGAASLTIYFQKREYEKMIEEINRKEQELNKMLLSGRQLSSF